MPRKLRKPKARTAMTPQDFERRARWGGLLDGIPALTDDERAEWESYRRSQPDWVPQVALHYAWTNADALHGRGEWSRDQFMAALVKDSREIEEVIREHPHRRARLAMWLAQMEQLIDREMNAQAVGMYYERLQGLGYDGTETE